MIIVIGGIKGGGGKTTIATNLAVLQSECSKVLLVDADEQRSASDWAAQREALNVKSDFTTIQLTGKSIHSQIQKLAQDFDDIIIDVGGRDTTSQRSALTVADLCVVPFRPRSLDAWTVGQVKAMLSEVTSVNHKLRVLAVINQADSKGTDNLDVMELIRGNDEEPWLLPCPESLLIGNRKAFANASSSGLSVVELNREDSKASEEIKRLHEYLYVTCPIHV